MGKKNKGVLTFVLLATLSLGGIAYFSSGFSNWTADGWRDRLTPVSSEEPPVSSEEYQLIFNKNQDYSLDFNGSDITNSTTLSQDFSVLDNLISLSSTHDDIVVTLSYPDEDDQHYFIYITIYSTDYASGDYTFTYLDSVSNDKLYGTYDFSNITLTEADQVLNPIYTPF